MKNLTPLFEGHAAANTAAIKKGTLWIGAISTVLSFLVTLAIAQGWVPEGLISQQLISEIFGHSGHDHPWQWNCGHGGVYRKAWVSSLAMTLILTNGCTLQECQIKPKLAVPIAEVVSRPSEAVHAHLSCKMVRL